MKKLFFLFVAILFSAAIIGQVATTPIKVTAISITKAKDSITMVVRTTQPEKIAEKIILQDSAIKEQAKTIDVKDSTIAEQEVKINTLKNSIEENLLMGKPLSFYEWWMFFYLWGILIWWLGHAIKGTISKKNTSPKRLSLSYWWQQPENKVKVYTAILVLFAGFFMAAFTKFFTGKELDEFMIPWQILALVFGASWQATLDLFMGKIVLKNYVKIPETNTPAQPITPTTPQP